MICIRVYSKNLQNGRGVVIKVNPHHQPSTCGFQTVNSEPSTACEGFVGMAGTQMGGHVANAEDVGVL